MYVRRLAYVVLVFLCAGPASSRAQGTGVLGKWYKQTGSAPYITIYKAGPEYSASLTDTQGVIATGSSRARPGRYEVRLSQFSVTGNNVRFLVVQTNYTSDEHVHRWLEWNYDLTLSDDGTRLIGTSRVRGYSAGEATSRETLYRRD